MKKYELTDISDTVNGITLYRIRYLKRIISKRANIKEGDLGGFIQSEQNLSQDGECVVLDNAIVLGDAMVQNNAVVKDNAIVSNHAVVNLNALVMSDAVIGEHALITDDAVVRGHSHVGGHAQIKMSAIINHVTTPRNNKKYHINNHVVVAGEAQVSTQALVFGNVFIGGTSIIQDYVELNGVNGKINVYGHSQITAHAKIKGTASITDSFIYGACKIDGTVEIKDSDISGKVEIKGICEIFSSNLYDSAKIFGSKLYEKTTLRHNSRVETSELWNVRVKDSAIIQDCEMRGTKTWISGQSALIQVFIDVSEDINICDDARLVNVDICRSKRIHIKENTIIQGMYNKVYLDCLNTVFEGSCTLNDAVDGCPIQIVGANIEVRDFVSITGGFELKDNVILKDFVEMINETDVVHTYERTTLEGDLKIVV